MTPEFWPSSGGQIGQQSASIVRSPQGGQRKNRPLNIDGAQVSARGTRHSVDPPGDSLTPACPSPVAVRIGSRDGNSRVDPQLLNGGEPALLRNAGDLEVEYGKAARIQEHEDLRRKRHLAELRQPQPPETDQQLRRGLGSHGVHELHETVEPRIARLNPVPKSVYPVALQPRLLCETPVEHVGQSVPHRTSVGATQQFTYALLNASHGFMRTNQPIVATFPLGLEVEGDRRKRVALERFAQQRSVVVQRRSWQCHPPQCSQRDTRQWHRARSR